MEKFKEKVDFSKIQLMDRAFSYLATGFSDSEKNFAAGVNASREAIQLLQSDKYSFALAVISPDYDYKKVYEGIRSVLKNVPILMIVNNFVSDYSGGSERGVAVSVFSDRIAVDVGIAKGFSLGARKALQEAVSGLINEPPKKEYRYLMVFSPNSIPLSGENTFNAIVEFSDHFEGVIGGVIGNPERLEYQLFVYNGKSYTDHAFLVQLQVDVKLHIDQAHGFHPVRPFKITGVRGDMIISLDDEPAFYALLDILSRRGYSEEDLRDPVKASRILNSFQFAVADKNKPGIFRALIPLNISEKGIRINAFLNEGDTIWLMESSVEEIYEAVDKMGGRVLGRLEKVNGAILFENFVRRRVLSAEEYVREKNIIFEAIKGPYLLIETVEEIVISENLYPGAHMGSIVGIFF